MTDREAFDSFLDTQYEKRPENITELCWDVWQAATAATQERCAQAVKKLDRKKWFPSQRDFAEACVDAIRRGE